MLYFFFFVLIFFNNKNKKLSIQNTFPETIEVDLLNLSNTETSNVSKAVATGPIINLGSATPTGNNSGRSVSPNLSNLSHLSQPVKKESNLRSWFHLPTAFNSTNSGRLTPAPAPALDVTTTSIYAAVGDTQNSAAPTTHSDNNTDDSHSPQQSMQKNKKIPSKKTNNFGESYYNKQNKIKEQKFTSPGSPAPSTSSTPSTSNVVVVPPTPPTTSANNNNHSINNQTNNNVEQQQQQQTKSSRRTTSLLNLFMSNSQGNNSSHLTYIFKIYSNFFFPFYFS